MRLTSSSWLMIVLPLIAAAQDATSQPSPIRPPDVRLVVLVSVDQLRSDLITRNERYFAPDGGFRRLLDRGAFFANAHYSYASTSTAPGHATLGSGRLPRQHGIVANDWLPPGESRGRALVSDPQTHVVGLAADQKERAGCSPQALIGPTLADQLKLNDRRSRIFSVSLKDRAAILLAGHNPDGVFWLDFDTGRMLSSTYYMQALPAYVQAFNDERWPDRYVGQSWDRIAPPEVYAGCYRNRNGWYSNLVGLGPKFPHRLPDQTPPDKRYYDALSTTPFGNDIVVEVVRRLMASEKPGGGPATDMLCIGFSSNDIIGHIFGADSEQVLDATLRTDTQLGELLDLLDQHVGLAHCVFALSADHGVTTVAQVAREAKVGGGLLDTPTVVQKLNGSLAAKFGALPDNRPYIADISFPWMSLDSAVGAGDPSRRAEIRRAAADLLRETEGVVAAFTAEDLAGAPPPRDELARWLAWRCYHPERSGDLYFKLGSFWNLKGGDLASHSNGNSYDRHVPILISGPRVQPGRYFTPADPLDVAPTLAAILGILPPEDASGRVLHEALRP